MKQDLVVVDRMGTLSQMDLSALAWAVDAVNTAMPAENPYRLVLSEQTGGTGDVNVMPRDQNNAGENNHDLDGKGTVYVNTGYTGTDTFSPLLVEIFMHELEHSAGLADITSGCSTADSIMVRPRFENGPFLSAPTSADTCSLSSSYWYYYWQGSECDPGGAFATECSYRGVYDPLTCTCSDPSPIVISFSGALKLTNAGDGVWFDLTRDGERELVAWPEPADDIGFLVLDRNGNGTIDDGGELFGNVTDQPAVQSRNGFNALSFFDRPDQGGNGDGVIGPADTVFPRLRIWFDTNHDGVSQPDELVTLEELGIVALDLDYHLSRRKDSHGNVFRWHAGVHLSSGRVIQAWDVLPVTIR